MTSRKFWNCVLILTAGNYCLPALAQDTSAAAEKLSKRVLGTWTDDLVKCKSTIESRGGKYYQILRDCRDLKPSEEISTPLIQLSADSFRENVRPAKSWHYKIAASGDLEVRDREGVVRSLVSVVPKTENQINAQRKG